MSPGERKMVTIRVGVPAEAHQAVKLAAVVGRTTLAQFVRDALSAAVAAAARPAGGDPGPPDRQR